MKKILKVKLSPSSINQLKQKMQTLQKDLEKIDEEIVEELAEFTLEKIKQNYDSTPFKDGNEDVSFFKRGSEKQKTVGVMGSQVLYNEFGTGTEGQKSPHPEKSRFNLKGYNTGKTIRKAGVNTSPKTGVLLGELYWTYQKDGETIYTQGIPAGKQVFNASESLRREKNKIVKKKVSDKLSKL